jgi:hypothetical protein
MLAPNCPTVLTTELGTFRLHRHPEFSRPSSQVEEASDPVAGGTARLFVLAALPPVSIQPKPLVPLSANSLQSFA